MTHLRVAHSVRTGLFTAVLFASLALAPSASWAGRGNQDRDRGNGRQQDQTATSPQSQPSRGAPPATRADQNRQPNPVQTPAAPAPPQQNVTPPGWAHQQRAPVNRWEIRPSAPDSGRQQAPGFRRQEPAPEIQAPYQPPRAPAPRGNAWGWQGSRDQQNGGGQLYRQPRRTSAPQGDNSSPGFDQPRLDRGNGSGQNPYQYYRPGRKVATPDTSPRGGFAREDRAQVPDRTQAPDRGTVARRGRGNTSRQDQGAVRQMPQDTPSLNRAGNGNRRPQAPRSPSTKGETRVAARPSLPRADRTFKVPEATFRGPDQDRLVRTVPKGGSAQLQTRMRERIRRENQQLGNWDARGGRMTHDVVGNRLPSDAVLLNRTNVVNNNITINYNHIVNDYGAPRFGFAFTPMFWDVQYHHRNSVIVLNFFYPYYYSDPYFAGFWYPGYYPAVYCFYGWAPAWVYPTRVYYAPAEYYYVPPVTPYRYYADYGPDYASANRAIGDLRQAWLTGDIGRLTGHLTDQLDIRVYFDGEYSYTTTTDDFYQMTLDTMATTQTVDMDFDNPIWISSHEVFVTGRQVFYDPDGDRHEVYVSFRLRQLGSGWYLVAIGSSLNPIQHQYTDYRYN